MQKHYYLRTWFLHRLPKSCLYMCVIETNIRGEKQEQQQRQQQTILNEMVAVNNSHHLCGSATGAAVNKKWNCLLLFVVWLLVLFFTCFVELKSKCKFFFFFRSLSYTHSVWLFALRFERNVQLLSFGLPIQIWVNLLMVQLMMFPVFGYFWQRKKKSKQVCRNKSLDSFDTASISDEWHNS